MATYTYECQAENCGERFEVKQSVHDEPLTKCEVCKEGEAKRIIVPGTSFRIGGRGVHRPTTRFNTSDDLQYRRN